MRLADLAKENIGVLHGEDIEIKSLSTDTRQIADGDLFLAINGENFDAHDYIHIAEEKGACALVVEKEVKTDLPYLLVEDSIKALGKIAALYRRHFSGKVVGLTGSSGKTTVKGMLQCICDAAGGCIATTGNLNNHIGVPLTLCRLKEEKAYAIIEAGTNGVGEIAYLTSLIQPEIALVNNVMPAHLGGFGSLAAIAEEKSDIYTGQDTECAVVNLDDIHLPTMLSKIKSNRIIGFALQEKSAKDGIEVVFAEEIKLDELGRAHFSVSLAGETIAVSLSVLGMHNLSNAMAAIAVSKALGIRAEHIKQGLEAFNGTDGRMQLLYASNGAAIINDAYNANPGSMKAAIDFLSQQSKNLLVCGGIGELGESSAQLHREVGQYAKEKNISTVLTVGDKAKDIAEGFGSGAEHFEKKEVMIERIKEILETDTVMLVKGSRSEKMETVVEAIVPVGVN